MNNPKKEARILVVSDTHGRSRLLQKLIKEESPFDMLIHCGDVEHDLYKDLGTANPFQIYVVKGNMDGLSYSRELLIEIAGHRIYVTHGDSLNVRYTNEGLYAKAREKKADVVLFGHTHVQEIEEHNGIFLMNPGSLTYPRNPQRIPTYGILKLREGEYPQTYLYTVPLSCGASKVSQILHRHG
ncbi:MAG: metallophosphoesterase [Blautia sp.]|nr:metallophosphoesterase [Blautia sp.]